MTPPGYESWPQFQEDGAAFGGSTDGRAGPSGTRGRRTNWPAAIKQGFHDLELSVRATRLALLAMFLASALLNLVVGIFICYRASPLALDGDEAEYWEMSNRILAGQWDMGERRTVAYPAIIAGFRQISSNFSFIQAVLSVISGLSAPLLYGVVRRLGGSTGQGLLAGILMLLWPAQLFLATSLYSETVALPCFLLFLLALPPGSRTILMKPRHKHGHGALLAGLALGLCAQIRPMYLLFLPFALIIPFLEERSRRRAGRTAVLVALGLAIVIAPWSAWMTSRHGHVIILTANGGETLAGGLNPRLATMADTEKHLANRDTWVGPGKWLPPQDTGYLSPAESRLPYNAMSRLLQQRSIAWIAAHPREALRIEFCKLAYMWGFYPWRGDDPARLLVGNLPILALLGIALGVVVSRRADVPTLAVALARLWMVPLFVTGIALISWGSWRFRQPADAALLALCVIAAGLVPRRAPGSA